MASQAQHHLVDVFPRAVGAPTEMRVCHVMSADLWAGAEVQVATVASYLAARPDVNLSAVLLNEGRLARELRKLGVPVTVIDEHQNSAMNIVTFLTRILKTRDVEVVHTHRYKDNVLGSIAAKLAGVPHVIRTVHGPSEPMRGWSRAKFQAYDALDKATLWCFADRIIAVSKRMADTLKHSGYKRTPVTCIPNGVDLRHLKATRTPEEVRRELGIDSSVILLGTAGRLSDVKGHVYLLRAARQILQRESRAQFVFVGSGPLIDELLASARVLGVDRACLFVGHRNDVYDLIAAMDIFVLPSLDEGIPMVVLEAMALGRPVVATAVGGVPEIVRHRATGLLVKPRDEQALADACLDLALNRDWAQTLGTRARQVVEEECSHERNGDALMEVYRSVVFGSRSGGVRSPVRTTSSRLTLPWRFAGRVVTYGQRKLDHAVERWRMNRIRRRPGPVMTKLKSAKRILFVCHGNIIRSAFSARLAEQAMGDDRRVAISSGGLEAVPGTPPHPTAVLTATRLGVDLRHHTAAAVTPDSVANTDVIFVMEIPHLTVMRRRFPDARAKTFLLTCLAPEAPLEIGDPIDGDESVFQACFDHISRAVQSLVRNLSDPFPPAVVFDRPALLVTEGTCQ